MLLDKFNWAKFGGHWFAMLGVGNLLGYGLYHFMEEKNYLYHFGYTGELRGLFRPLKSMIGSTSLPNVAWTSASLIGLNFYLM